MEYKEDYFDLLEDTLIPIADGTTKPVSMVQIGDFVLDKNENMCIVVDILTALKEEEKINYMGKAEKVRAYTLVLEER